MATRPYTGPSARPVFPIAGILGLIFVTLKLAGIGAVASWSWWWVLAPFWVPVALFLGILVLGLALWGLGLGKGKGIEVGIRAWDRRKGAKE